ncbi:nuclear transport factor 2 family protein [Vibrio tubiashii]|nr:nuclear transport factor 2 family protein [Vibrio tubiashii]
MQRLIILILGIFAMTAQANTITRDEAQIKSALNSFSAMADQGAYEYLGRLFAPVVTLDYTSLFGGEVSSTNRRDLMKQWAGFLPGFDTTFHDLDIEKVTISGDKADALADITASHWLGDEGFWQVSGQYEFTLIKAGDSWQIESVKLNRLAEEGSRDILGLAPQRAAENRQQRSELLVKLD